METAIKRSGHILNSKLRKYLIPTIATALAMSLNEFVDSILAANLLDLRSMTVISVASPIMLIFAAIYVLFGVGGSTLYALNIGQRDTKKAGKAFVLSMGAAVLLGCAICIAGQILIEPAGRLLCSDESMQADLQGYLRILFLSAPVLIGIQTLACFLPAAGAPNIATLICLVANGVNLLCDWLYIRFGHMGVEGTALATLTGYVACLVLLIVLLARKKIRLHAARPASGDLVMIGDVFKQGGASALAQVGYTIKFTFFNNLALRLGGQTALQVFAICQQLISIMSIGLAGIVDAVGPFMAAMRGQKDANGIRYVLQFGIIWSTIISGVMVILFEIFPQILYAMFNVQSQEVIAMATGGVRIFLIMFMIRELYLLFMVYSRIIGRSLYSMIISLVDGFVLLIPVALLCTVIFGIDGIWMSFPVNSALILVGVLLYNRLLLKKSNGKLYSLFLLENEEGVTVCDMTINEENENISHMSEKLIAFCRENSVGDHVASRIGLIAEEMAMYTRLHRKKDEEIDIIARISKDAVTLDFRSEGTPFNPLARSDEDSDENILLINKIPSDVEYDYILGMNSTRFTMENN